MKKLMVVAVALLALSCNKTKVAYVDIDEILKEYKGMKEAQKELEAKEGDMKKSLDQLAMNYQTGLKDYQEKVQRMSAKKRQETENTLMQQQQLLNQSQQAAQLELQKFGQEKMEEINEEIEDFVADYAKTNGFTHILGTSKQANSVLYGTSDSDLTDAILEGLNDAFKKESKKETTAVKDSIE